MVWRTADDEGVNTADWLGGCQLSSVAVIARLGGCRAEQEDKSQRTVHGEVWARATEACALRCGGSLACRTRRARGGGRLRRPPRGAGGAPREAQRAAGNRTEVGALNPISAPGARWAGSGLPLPFGAETPLPLPLAQQPALGAGGWCGRGVPWVWLARVRAREGLASRAWAWFSGSPLC